MEYGTNRDHFALGGIVHLQMDGTVLPCTDASLGRPPSSWT